MFVESIGLCNRGCFGLAPRLRNARTGWKKRAMGEKQPQSCMAPGATRGHKNRIPQRLPDLKDLASYFQGRSFAALPMNKRVIATPLRGWSLILASFPGLRCACPGLLSCRPSGAVLLRSGAVLLRSGAVLARMVHPRRNSTRRVGLLRMTAYLSDDCCCPVTRQQ